MTWFLPWAAGYAEDNHIRFHAGNVFSSDVFYEDQPGEKGIWAKMGVLVQEMETMSLYCTAARAGKQALGILTAEYHRTIYEKNRRIQNENIS